MRRKVTAAQNGAVGGQMGGQVRSTSFVKRGDSTPALESDIGPAIVAKVVAVECGKGVVRNPSFVFPRKHQ